MATTAEWVREKKKLEKNEDKEIEKKREKREGREVGFLSFRVSQGIILETQLYFTATATFLSLYIPKGVKDSA